MSMRLIQRLTRNDAYHVKPCRRCGKYVFTDETRSLCCACRSELRYSRHMNQRRSAVGDGGE